MNSSSGVSPREELLGLVVEVVELALEDRDDVARDVLVDLGVLERALAALALLGSFGLVSIETGSIVWSVPLRCRRGAVCS